MVSMCSGMVEKQWQAGQLTCTHCAKCFINVYPSREVQ